MWAPGERISSLVLFSWLDDDFDWETGDLIDPTGLEQVVDLWFVEEILDGRVVSVELELSPKQVLLEVLEGPDYSS